MRGDPAFPFVLAAGERRTNTANTIFRDPAWRRKDADGALRMNPADAARLGLADGGRARLTTKRASVETVGRAHRHAPARPRDAAERARRGLPGRAAAARRCTASRRTSSPPPKTATGSPARRGTSTCPRASRPSHEPQAARPRALPDRAHHRAGRRRVDAAAAAQHQLRTAPLRRAPARARRAAREPQPPPRRSSSTRGCSSAGATSSGRRATSTTSRRRAARSSTCSPRCGAGAKTGCSAAAPRR